MIKTQVSLSKTIESGKALGTRLTSTKIKKIPTDRPYSQIEGRVTANEQFFKSSLIKNVKLAKLNRKIVNAALNTKILNMI